MPRLARLLLALAALLCSMPAAAQRNVHTGLKGGLAFSDVTDVRLSSTRNGFTAGGFLAFDLPLLGKLQTEVLFVQKGYEVHIDFLSDNDGTILLGNVDANFLISYLEIPVLLRLSIPAFESVAPEFFFGPAIAFKMSQKSTFENTSDEDRMMLEAAEADFGDFDAGVVIGAGFSRPFGKQTIGIDMQYNLGLVDLIDAGLSGNPVHNRAFAVMLRLGFGGN